MTPHEKFRMSPVADTCQRPAKLRKSRQYGSTGWKYAVQPEEYVSE